jgi:glucokinase
MAASRNIGIDIGGSKIIFALLENRRILRFKKIPTPKARKKLIGVLAENTKRLLGSAKAESIGIGVPGPINKKRDLILNPPNLKYLRNCPLARLIEKETGIKTLMDNDVNCFVLGEALAGAGIGAETVFGITLGTGVGGGLVINKKIFRGAFGAAGEVGHMTIKFDGEKCGCRSSGCLEAYCSEKFFIRRGISPKECQDKAYKGDRKAFILYNEYGRYLGIGLANIINLFDPEVIVIGGGIAQGYKFFISSAKREIKKRVISPVSRKYVKIKKAALGELGGAVGAAILNNYA